MTFIQVPTEQTTAATDALLGVVALACAVYVWRIGRGHRWKAGVWSLMFATLSLSSFLGAAAHGFEMSTETNDLLWRPLTLSLGFVIAFFVSGAVCEAWGDGWSRRSLAATIPLGILFYFVANALPGRFRVFVVYEAVAMFVSLGVYLYVALGKRKPGSGLMVAGIVVTIAAAGVQATESLSLTFVWQFDHNGIFHLIQVAGVPLLLSGLRRSLLQNGAGPPSRRMD